MSNTIIETYESLNEIAYGPKMKEKFEQLGIPTAWKAGKKKVDLINNALVMLKELADAQEQGKTVEQIKEANAIVEAEKLKGKQVIKKSETPEEQKQEKPIIESKDETEKPEVKIVTEKITKSKQDDSNPYSEFTKQHIEKNIRVINANLGNRPSEATKKILLKKKGLLLQAVSAK